MKVLIEKMYQCDVCMKNFTQRTNRNRHRRQFHAKDSQNGKFLSFTLTANLDLIQNVVFKGNLLSSVPSDCYDWNEVG